jgi:trimeric autotransporter adhesin
MIGATASGDYSFSAGAGNVASGEGSVAVGQDNIASGDFSTATGKQDTASGIYSFVAGYESKASGQQSFAQGHEAVASNTVAVAIGNGVTASGYGSYALGKNYTNSKDTSFAVGFTTRKLEVSPDSVIISPTNAFFTRTRKIETAYGDTMYVWDYNRNEDRMILDPVKTTIWGRGSNAKIEVYSDSILLNLTSTGELVIDGLKPSSRTYDKMMVWDSASAKSGYREIPSGGSVSSASGSGISLVNGSSAIKRLKAGSGITITDNTDSVTIASEYTTVSKSSDQTTSSTSLVDCTDLGFSADANATYEWEAMVVFTADASTTGIALNMNGPSATYTLTTFNIAVGGSGQTIGNSTAFSPTAYYNSTSSNGTGVSLVTFKGIARTTASGTVQFKFMPEAGSGGSITVKQYSFMKYRKIN